MSENGLSKERLTWMYTQMARIREFEERVKRTFEEHPGVIRGHTHLADGAEASIVGSLAALRPDDQLTATYRGHGYPIALGTDTKALMAEIYGKETGICKGYGGSMHLIDVGRGFLGTSGIVGQGIPHAAGAAWAAQIRGKGQVVLSFFGDGASKQGAFHETLNIASLWKLPVVFVMENNNYQAYTRVEQEDANAAAGEPLAVKAKAYSMPGVTVDGGDPVAVYDVVHAAVERARSGDGPTLVESLVYRLSAHGNIIAPPGVPLHYPEHEAIHVFGNVEEYEAAKRGDPVPRFRARLVTDGCSPPRRRTRSPRRRSRRCRRRSSSGSRARSRRPRRPSSTSTPEEDRDMARELPYIQAIGEAVHQEMARDETVIYFGQNLGAHRGRPLREGVRRRPRPRDADLGDGGDRDGGRRGVRGLPAGRPAVHGRVHARRDGPGRERGASLLRHDAAAR